METYGLLSLVPPVVAIGLALVTRQVFISLLIGLWLGFVVLAGGNPLQGFLDLIDGLTSVFESAWNTRIVVFTLLIGALIALVQRSGGVQGFVDRVVKRLMIETDKPQTRTQRIKVELLAMVTGVILFIESNISILTVGTLYRPVFDRLNIPREKLAYITDSTCAPICILIPFNAWGAYIIGLLGEQNLGGQSAMDIFISAMMFNFYAIIAILIVVFVIISGKDVGEMKEAEIRTRNTGKLLRDGAQPMMAEETVLPVKEGVTAKARNMVIPIASMVALMFVFLITTGWADGGGSILGAMREGAGDKAVLYATITASVIAAALYKISGTMGLRESMDVSLKGMSGMVPLAFLMVLAFALGALCKTLGTGHYVADVAKGFISPALVPALIFLIAGFIAFSTGTSWGTFAIMIAIAVPLAQGMDTNIALAVAAAIGGGIFGDHCSPISDTSIMTSMATANDHIDHVRTQLPYALIGGGLTLALYLLLGVIGV